MADIGFTRNLSVLKSNVCWVVFRFPDNSVKALRTTLRTDLLDGLDIEENALYDLDYRRWFNLRRVEGSQIEIYTEKPDLKGVDIFASKFIT